jgi:hypothetical protein
MPGPQPQPPPLQPRASTGEAKVVASVATVTKINAIFFIRSSFKTRRLQVLIQKNFDGCKALAKKTAI